MEEIIMKRLFKTLSIILVGVLTLFSLTSCITTTPAENQIQKNVLRDIGNFKTYRNIKVINLRSGIVLMEFEGYLTSKKDLEGDLNIIIMVGKDSYQLHYVRLAPEITYLSEQIDNTTTDPYHWKINVYATVPDVTFGV
jgi:hypothetical protein